MFFNGFVITEPMVRAVFQIFLTLVAICTKNDLKKQKTMVINFGVFFFLVTVTMEILNAVTGETEQEEDYFDV